LLLAGGGWYFYKRRQKLQANTMLHSMAMQQQQPAAPTGTPAAHYMPGTSSSGLGAGVTPGAMMALVCCIALLSLMSLPTADAAGLKWESRKEEVDNAFAHVVASGVTIVLVIASVMTCCCPGTLVALAAGR
jgi:hypothetical protein